MGAVSRASAATRLAAMPGQKRLAGALAAVAVAVAISACGSSGDNATIPPENANQLTAALNGVQDAVDAQDCQLAKQRAHDFINAVNELPDTVGTADKDALRSAGENLEKLASNPSQCVPSTGTTGLPGQQTTSTTQSTTSVPTTTVPTTTTTTSTTQTTPPENGGGNQGNGGGGSSGNGGGETGGGSNTSGGGGGEAGGGSGGTGGTGTGGTGGGTG